MMSEAALSYREDIVNRKKIANGALHKANGVAVAKLGNKPMTRKEIEEKHGPCIQYPSLDGLMNYADFVKLPDDLKIEYVIRLCDKYDIEIKHISRYLFNKGDDGLRAYLRSCKIKRNNTVCTVLSQCCPHKQRGKAGLEKFQADVKAWSFDDLLARNTQTPAKKPSVPGSAFLSYEEFLKLPVEDQITFVNTMIDRYHVTSKALSVILFEKRINTLSNHFCELKVNERITKLPRKMSVNKETMTMNEAVLRKDVNAWKGLTNGKEDIALSPDVKQAIQEFLEEKPENKETTGDLDDIHEGKVLLKLPDDSEFELEYIEEEKEPRNAIPLETARLARVCTLEEVGKLAGDIMAKVEPEPGSDPMQYSDMRFEASYISDHVDTDQFYIAAQLFKKCKRVKVEFTITEV